MHTAFTRTITTALTAVALLALAVAPAGAALLTVHDARGDMWRQSADGSTTTKAPNATNGDVLSARIRYAPRQIVVTTHYADLARLGRYANYTARLQSGQGITREVTLETGPGNWQGKIRVFDRKGDLTPHCVPGRKVDYTANTVQVTVPAGCLSTPAYVRANINDSRAIADGTFFLDNVHDQKAQSGAWTHWVHHH